MPQVRQLTGSLRFGPVLCVWRRGTGLIYLVGGEYMIAWFFAATSGIMGADLDEEFYNSLCKEQAEEMLLELREIKKRLTKIVREAQ
jgi:hypothetical protein